MTGTIVDFNEWPRAEQFRFFRTFDRPHYATTVRLDVSELMARRKDLGLSPFRHAIWSIGAGLHAVPELCMRFRDEVVTRFDTLLLSSTIPLDNGDFRYCYMQYDPDRAAFDEFARQTIEKVKAGGPLGANDGTIANVAYLSCLPWLDYTSLDNALPGPDDCIPRISWGKIVPKRRWLRHGHDHPGPPCAGGRTAGGGVLRGDPGGADRIGLILHSQRRAGSGAALFAAIQAVVQRAPPSQRPRVKPGAASLRTRPKPSRP